MFPLTSLLLSLLAAAPLPLRTWTDSTGEKTVEAEFLVVSGENVLLRKAGDDILTIPIKRLSEADRAYVARHRAERIPAPRKHPRKALVTKVDYDFVDKPLTDVVEYFDELVGVQIEIDAKVLDDTCIDVSPGITAKGKDIPLADALTLLLKPLELAWFVTDEVIVVSAPEEARKYLVTEVYALRGEVNPHKLIEELTANFALDFAIEKDPGVLVLASDKVLLVRQTDQNQYALRSSHPKQLQVIEGLGDPPPAKRTKDKVEPAEALLQETVLEFDETPLREVLDYLSKLHGVNIDLQPRASDVGITRDTPITCNLKGITLKSALNLMVRELGLTWTVHEDLILIRIIDSSEEKPRPQSYKIDDLAKEYRTDTLINGIIITISPNTWETVGGPGSIRLGGRGVLEVRQTQQVHEEIQSLLTRLRLAAN